MHVSTTYHPILRRRNAESRKGPSSKILNRHNRAYPGHTADRPRQLEWQIRNDELVLNWAAGSPATSSLSDGDARSLSVHPSRNVHRSQLLEEQLGCIRNVHLRDPRLVLARPAFKRILLEIPDVIVSKDRSLSSDFPCLSI